MKSEPFAIFRAGSNLLVFGSVAFIVIAIAFPLYLYPDFFFSTVLNFFPFIIIVVFIIGYNIVQYRKRATIEVYFDMIIIRTTKKTVKIRFGEIKQIDREQQYGKNLFLLKTKSGRSVALYDRKMYRVGQNLLDFIQQRINESEQ